MRETGEEEDEKIAFMGIVPLTARLSADSPKMGGEVVHGVCGCSSSVSRLTTTLHCSSVVQLFRKQYLV